MGSGGWEGEFPDNSVFKRQNLLSFIIQPSKQKPPVKTSKPSKPSVIYYTAFKNKNHLSKSSKPAVKTCCQNIKTIKTTCQNHQNLLSKPAVKTSKPSKPPVKIIKTCCQNIKTIKTTCQKHQNLLSITSKPSKPPVKTSNLLSIT